MPPYNYQRHEELFSRLLSMLASRFSEAELTAVRHYIDYSEYGLAFDTLIYIIENKNKQISNSEVKLIYDLANIMLIDKTEFESKLRGHISDHE